MTRNEIGSVVREELGRLAPEVDFSSLEAGTRIREELDLDSFDFTRFVSALHERLGVDVPESDYGRLESFGGCLDYFEDKMA